MKRILLPALLSIIFFSVNAQIKVSSTGSVGINNTNPVFKLDVNGNFRVNDNGDALIFQYGTFYSDAGYSSLGNSGMMWDELYAYQGYFYYCDVYYSDVSLKTDIKSLISASGQLKQLRPVTYKMKPVVKEGREPALQEEVIQMGFVAQEVQDIFPEIVVADNNQQYLVI